MEPKLVFWNRCPAVVTALRDWGQLIQEAAIEPTHVNELVSGTPDWKAALDASGEGAGGVWIPGNKSIAPIVWRVKWPREVVDRLVTDKNPAGDITNSDLEMAAEVLGFLVLEASVPTRHTWACVATTPRPWRGKRRAHRSAPTLPIDCFESWRFASATTGPPRS